MTTVTQRESHVTAVTWDVTSVMKTSTDTESKRKSGGKVKPWTLGVGNTTVERMNKKGGTKLLATNTVLTPLEVFKNDF